MPIRPALTAALIPLLVACAVQQTATDPNLPVATEYDSTAEVGEAAAIRPEPIGRYCSMMFVSMLSASYQSARICSGITEAQSHNWRLLEAAMDRLVTVTGQRQEILRQLKPLREYADKANDEGAHDEAVRERICHGEIDWVKGFRVAVAKPVVETYLSAIAAGLDEIAKYGLPEGRERAEICGAL